MSTSVLVFHGLMCNSATVLIQAEIYGRLCRLTRYAMFHSAYIDLLTVISGTSQIVSLQPDLDEAIAHAACQGSCDECGSDVSRVDEVMYRGWMERCIEDGCIILTERQSTGMYQLYNMLCHGSILGLPIVTHTS